MESFSECSTRRNEVLLLMVTWTSIFQYPYHKLMHGKPKETKNMWKLKMFCRNQRKSWRATVCRKLSYWKIFLMNGGRIIERTLLQ